MLFLHLRCFVLSSAGIILFLMYCSFAAYKINAKRNADDPDIRDYASLSPWLTPGTPVLWLGQMIILAPLTIPFGIFLVLFPFILILLRPVPENDPIKRAILKIGNNILKFNTMLLAALGLHSKPIRFQVK